MLGKTEVGAGQSAKSARRPLARLSRREATIVRSLTLAALLKEHPDRGPTIVRRWLKSLPTI